MTDFENRAAARLEAAVRKTLEEGQLGADAAPCVPTPLPLMPGNLRAGRAVHVIAVHGDGNVVHVGFGAARPPGGPVRDPGARQRASLRLAAVIVALAALALMVAFAV